MKLRDSNSPVHAPERKRVRNSAVSVFSVVALVAAEDDEPLREEICVSALFSAAASPEASPAL
ncbi:hypothetical protein D3C81_837190 [compost metagenome]